MIILDKFILYTALFIPVLVVSAQNEMPVRLGLEDCINIGLQNNPGFQSSQISLEENKTKVDEARSGFYPTLQASSGANVYSRNNGEQQYEIYNKGISASYTVFSGFRTKAGYDAAKENYSANVYRHESNKQELTLLITYGYYRTLQAERILTSAREAVKNSKLHLEFARARHQAGIATLSDVLKAEVELSNAELSRIQSANVLLNSKGSLNQLMGLPSNNPLELIDNLSVIGESLPLSYDSLFQEALVSRTEIKQFQSLLKAQNSFIDVAKAESYPTINVYANYSFEGEELLDMQRNWGLGLSFSVPVFKGFSTKARIAGEELAFKGLEKDMEALKQQITLEVWNAFLAVEESSEKIETTLKGLESARKNLAIVEGEYKEGIGSIIQLTDAQTTFVSSEQQYIRSVADYKIACAELKRTVGNL
jgi:outer membrane protein TolC